jgi:hypothetical protein
MGMTKKIAQVTMLLRNVVYISYLVPASRVRPFLPGIIESAIIEGDRTFISVVILQCRDVRLSFLPFPRFNYTQVNVRTYIVDPSTGSQGVFFLKSSVTSSPLSFLTRILGPSWEHCEVDYQAVPDEKTGLYRQTASGYWHGDFALDAEETGNEPDNLAPFTDTESAINYLLRPLIGLYGKQGYVGRFEISHPYLRPSTLRLHDFNCELLQSMDLVKKEEVVRPHSILVVPESRFDIYLPPRRIIIKQ